MSVFQRTLVLLAFGAAIGRAADEAPAFKVTPRRADDRVDVKVEKDRATFSVHSPTGISRAEIERRGDAWPKDVVIRLHLQGLERFQVSNGAVALAGAVAVRKGKPVVRLWKDGKEEAPLDASSPLWITVRALEPEKGQGKEPGGFELALPRALFEGSPRTLTAEWIDFYRN